MLNFILYSVLFLITSNYKLYVIPYYNHYIIIQITNLIWMAWSEQFQVEQDQYRKSSNFSLYLYAAIFLTICTFMIAHPELKIKSYL